MKKNQKKNHFFPLPPAPTPGYPQDPDPQKKCGSETLVIDDLVTKQAFLYSIDNHFRCLLYFVIAEEKIKAQQEID